MSYFGGNYFGGNYFGGSYFGAPSVVVLSSGIGDGVLSTITPTDSFVSMVAESTGLHSAVSVSLSESSTINIEFSALSGIVNDNSGKSLFEFNQPGTFSGMGNKEASTVSIIDPDEAALSLIDITPLSAYSMIRISTGRISGVTTIADIMSPINDDTGVLSAVGSSATGIKSNML